MLQLIEQKYQKHQEDEEELPYFQLWSQGVDVCLRYNHLVNEGKQIRYE